MAGVAKIDATPPIGAPLAGYGSFDRRLFFPVLSPDSYNHLFKPSVGVRDPIYVKALALSNGQTTVAIVTLDTIAVDRSVVEEAYTIAAQRGVPLSLDNVMVCAAHTHSGPAAMSKLFLWEIITADLSMGPIREPFIEHIADVLVEACANMRPARLGIGSGEIYGITHNRRNVDSSRVESEDIDPTLGVLRIDEEDGRPMAVLWNFAIHGSMLPASNLSFSADIMGACNAYVEEDLGCVSLFANGAEGDTGPDAHGEDGLIEGGSALADKVIEIRNSLTTTDSVQLANHSRTIEFGPGYFHLNPGRIGETTSTDPGATCPTTIQYYPGFTVPLESGWIETSMRFQAIRLNDVVITSVPGEAITELGLQIKSDGASLGFSKTFIFGLANGYMAYIVTEPEYWCGGYEPKATFWGPSTAAQVRNACYEQMSAVRQGLK